MRMDKLTTTTELKCEACKRAIPMFTECHKDGIYYYHSGCRPVKTMESRQEFKIADTKEEE